MGAEMGTEGKEGLGEEYRHKAKCAQKLLHVLVGQSVLPSVMWRPLNSGEEGDSSATFSCSHEHQNWRQRQNNQQMQRLSPTRSGAQSASEVMTLDKMQCHFQPEMRRI